MNRESNPILREHFTAKIAGYLQSGFKVNVYSEEKQGLRKLVEDLRQSGPEDIHFVGLNMRSHAHSFDSYLLALSDALELNKPDLDHRTALLTYLDQHPEKKIWLCLENFHELSEKTVNEQKVDRQGFNLDFITHLNSFGNNQRVALLFTSHRLLKTQELYIGGERVRGSKIDVKHQDPLPELLFSEIEAYLQQITPPSVSEILAQKPVYYNLLISEIAAHPDPIDFMHFIADSIPDDPKRSLDQFKQLMAHWKKRYNQQQRHSTDLQLNNWARFTKHLKNQALRLIGIGKNLTAFHKRILIFLTLIFSIAWFWWEKMVSFFDWIF